jgi:hypothetical protein
MSSMLAWGMSPQDSISKYLQKGWAVAQVVECLHSNQETLSSNPTTTKKKKKCSRDLPAQGPWHGVGAVCPAQQIHSYQVFFLKTGFLFSL